MIICLAQTAPVKGDVDANVAAYLKFIEHAVAANADFILFPELSLTGYEPTLAEELATTPNDSRFGVFQKQSNENNITIAVGTPLQSGSGITIGLVIFSPHKRATTYSKQYLHSDEEPFFISGQNNAVLFDEKEKAALAICYELSVTEHAQAAFQNGAKLYLASVAKTADGMGKASGRLSQVAKQYGMTAAVVNCIGVNDGVVCSGGSAIWNKEGELLSRLDNNREGVLLFNTETSEFQQQYV